VRASIELVCFDLDGTLVDSAPDICDALGGALEAVGLPPPTLEQTRGWIGNGIEKLLWRALAHAGTSEAEIFRIALAAFHERYSRGLFRTSRLYPDVERVLQTLEADGFRLGCITNKRSDYATALLGHAGIIDRFELVFGGDSFTEKKPHPRQLLEAAGRTGAPPRRCVMVGDTDADAQAAASAGFGFIWVSFGYCRALTDRDPATLISVDSFAEIPATLAALLP
jgi:phosphoglycolate phosphatase